MGNNHPLTVSCGVMARVAHLTEDELDSEYREFLVLSLQPDKAANVYAGTGNNPVVLRGL